MNKIILRIDKERHVYPPKHKKFVQLYKQSPYILEEDKDSEIIPLKEWEYEGKQIEFDEVWEGGIETNEEGEEIALSAEQYIYKNFEDVWNNN